MAVRLSRRQVTNHTASIQTSKILKVLSDHVINGTEMEASRITAGLGLLKKTLPDLKSVDLQGNLEVNGSWTVKLS